MSKKIEFTLNPVKWFAMLTALLRLQRQSMGILKRVEKRQKEIIEIAGRRLVCCRSGEWSYYFEIPPDVIESELGFLGIICSGPQTRIVLHFNGPAMRPPLELPPILSIHVDESEMGPYNGGV
jgi:hypothetical protein